MKDITEAAQVAARESVTALRRLASLLLFTLFLFVVGGGLMAATFFVLRFIFPNLSTNNAMTTAVMSMILPTAAIGWFGIVFSVELEQRRKQRE